MAELWTVEDVELVARAMKVEFGTAEGWDKAPDWIRRGYRESAVTVLAALAEAGRLLPADGEWEWAAGTRYVIRPATPDRREAEAQALDVRVADPEPAPEEKT